MVKMITFPLIYCAGFIVLSFSSDINGIGSSISVAVASGSGIENAKSFSHARARRAVALLVPFDDENKSSEEHHKSKRCWRALGPVRKARLSLDPEEAEEETYGTTGRAQGAKYNFRKSYDDRKRSAENSEEESSDSSSESLERNSGRKFPYLKIVPVINPGKNLKEFLGTEREIATDGSEENSDDVILNRIKNHLNSDDYKVLALVGKRAKCPPPNKPKKYVCYCRAAGCSGGNCQRMMYGPCSTCRNSRPGFAGKVKSNPNLDGARNYYYKNQKTPDKRMPLKIQYPANNPGTPSTTRDVNKFDRQKFRQYPPVAQDRRYQFSHHTPEVVLANRNNNLRPLDQCRILRLPISSKSATEGGISSPNIPANVYSPAVNEYRPGNAKFSRDRDEYNRWVVSSYHPSIGNAAGALETGNKNHGINGQKVIELYQSSDGLIGSKTPFADRGNVASPHPATPGLQIGQNLRTTGPEMATNLHSINGFGWNIPNGMRTLARPQQQSVQTPFTAYTHRERPESSFAQSYGEKNHRVEEYVEEKDPGFDFEVGGYDASTEDNFSSATSSEMKSYAHGDESKENNSRDGSHEDSTERQIIDGQVSLYQNPARAEDQRNFVNYVGVSDEPEKYQIPIAALEKGNPLEAKGFSHAVKSHGTLGSRETYTNGNSLTTSSGDSHEIIGSESPNYDDGNTDYSIYETTHSTQSGQAGNEQSNWDQYKEDEATSRVIDQPESDEDVSDHYLTYWDDRVKTPEPVEGVQLEAPEPKYSDVEGSGEKAESQKSTTDDYSDIQVITNGYFTSQAYNDIGEGDNGDIPVTAIDSAYDITHRSNPDVEESHLSSSKKASENVGVTIGGTTTADYSEDRKFGSSSIHQEGREGSEEQSIGRENQSLEDGITETSSSDDVSTNESQVVGETHESEFSDDDDDDDDDDSEIIDATGSRISNADDSGNLQTSSGREYSLVGSAESKKLNVGGNYVKSEGVIESSKEPETSSIEVVGRAETDSAENASGTFDGEDDYEVDPSKEEDTLISNQEDEKEDAHELSSLRADANNFENYSRSKSVESYRDMSYPGNYFGEHSMEESPVVFSEGNPTPSGDELVGTGYNENAENYEAKNYYNRVDDEGADAAIENSPTRYFSPHDRVLEYIKKHSQNSVRYFDPGNDEERRPTQGTQIHPTADGRETQYVTPEIYHKKNSRDESLYEGFDSGSESEEMITHLPKDGDDWYDYESGNSDERTAVDVNASQESPVKQEDTFVQSPRYEELDDVRMSDCGRYNAGTESIVYTEPRDGNAFGKSGELQRTPNKMHFIEPSDKILTTSFVPEGNTEGWKEHEDYDENDEYSPEADLKESNEAYDELVDDHAEEFHGPEGYESNYRMSSGNERSTGVTAGYENNSEDSTSAHILGKIQHLVNLDYESTEESTEYEASKYLTEASGGLYTDGEVDSAVEQPEKSIPTHTPMDTSIYDYDSAESTEGSVLLEKAQEQNYGTQSTTKNSELDDALDQNEFVLWHRTDPEEENSSNLSDDDSGGYDSAIERYNPVEKHKSSTETTIEEVKEDPKYYTTQATQSVDEFYPLGSSEPHYESPPEIYSEENLGQVHKSEKDSGDTKSAEFVSSSQSAGCCTKPPEVQKDSGYLGRLEPKKSNPDVKSLGDLVDSDLYYIGDGVKLPLTIKKLKDGSFALSISDKICEQRLKEKCPCCVPREGRILQEKHSEEIAEDSTEKTNPSSLHRRAIPDDEKSELPNVEQHEEMSEPKLNGVEKIQDHSRRTARSISMPVDEFAEKYNLILNLNDQLPGDLEAAEFSLRHNVIQRDEARIEQGNSDLIQKLVSINDVPENKRAGVLLSTLETLIATEPKEVFGVVNEMKNNVLQGVKSPEDNQEEGEPGGKIARYGYQKDNPILDRIRIIKQMQKDADRCEHRYQKDCNDAITQKTELLMMILYWLKELVESKPN